MIEYFKTPQRFTRFGMFRVTRWTSRDRKYTIERSKHLDGTLSTCFRALTRSPDAPSFDTLISRHRTRRAAERAVEAYQRKLDAPPTRRHRTA